MISIADGLLYWMLCELILSTGLLILYIALRRWHPNTHDRYFLLKWGFAAILVLPWISIPGLDAEDAKSPFVPINDISSHLFTETFPTAIVDSNSGPISWIQMGLLAVYSLVLTIRILNVFRELVTLRKKMKTALFLTDFEGVPVMGVPD